jgi:hypothetical protein
MPRMKLPRALLTVLILAVGLVAGASTAEAKHPKIFHPDQPPLSETGAFRAARAQIERLDRVKNPGKSYIRTASKRNARIVEQLNSRRSKRNKQRAAYLQDKISAYSADLINPINDRYDKGVDRAKSEYARDVERIKHGNDRGRRKQQALRRAREAYESTLHRLATVRGEQLNRANAVIADTKEANAKLYKRISERETRDVKVLKGRLRNALADLRNR